MVIYLAEFPFFLYVPLCVAPMDSLFLNPCNLLEFSFFAFVFVNTLDVFETEYFMLSLSDKVHTVQVYCTHAFNADDKLV